MNENEIIAEVLAGDSDRYQTLVERYHIGLIIHCENIVKQREDGEDIAQDAFITAFTKLSDYDPKKAKFSTWLYRIATNKCLDHLRKYKRKLDVDDIEQIAAVTEPTNIADDEIRRLREAVLRLTPPEYRRVVEAYFWEGKSYKTIADELSTNTNTVGVWVSRAKLQLREELS